MNTKEKSNVRFLHLLFTDAADEVVPSHRYHFVRLQSFNFFVFFYFILQCRHLSFYKQLFIHPFCLEKTTQIRQIFLQTWQTCYGPTVSERNNASIAQWQYVLQRHHRTATAIAFTSSPALTHHLGWRL